MPEDQATPVPGLTADGIFSGGGIKGLAFAGALAAAEEAGYTDWASLAGTSAGAITAMALAVGYDAAALRRLFSFDFSRINDRGGPFGLGVIEKPFHPIEGPLWPVAMLGDVIDTAINARDDFELEYFGNRVIAIPTGNVSTLNFSPTDAEKQGLYDAGHRTASEFFASADPTNRFGARPPAA